MPALLTTQVTCGAGLPNSAYALVYDPASRNVRGGWRNGDLRRLRLFNITWAVSGLELADPGFGFVTEICTFPTSEVVAVPLAVSSVAETKFVVSREVPKFTTAPFANDAPERVSVNAPTVNFDGETEKSCGIGFSKFAVAVAAIKAFDATVALIVTPAGAGTLAGAV